MARMAARARPPTAGSKRPFPTPSGPEEPRRENRALKGGEAPGKSPSPKAGSRKPSSDTIPAPIGSEGPEMRKGIEKKGHDACSATRLSDVQASAGHRDPS